MAQPIGASRISLQELGCCDSGFLLGGSEQLLDAATQISIARARLVEIGLALGTVDVCSNLKDLLNLPVAFRGHMNRFPYWFPIKLLRNASRFFVVLP